MSESKLKNFLRWWVKALNSGKYARYFEEVKKRGEFLPEVLTIFSSDCMAGLIYHSLGRKFYTPTINMSIRDADFLKLMEDYDYYKDRGLCFKSGKNYPVGFIGEGERSVIINFEHFTTNEEAASKWNERKYRSQEIGERFIIMADQNLTDREVERFKSLTAKRKIMFTWSPERADGREIFAVKTYGRERIKNYCKLRVYGFRDYERFFDYVAWLNMEDHFVKE